MEKITLPRFLKLQCLIYSDIEVENANLNISSSMENSEKYGISQEINLSDIYQQTDDSSEIMNMLLCQSELNNLISITPNYPVKRKKVTIQTCDLRFEKHIGKHYVNSVRNLIIGTPEEILSKIQTFLNQE